MSWLGRAWDALGVVLYTTTMQVHGDNACFTASAKGLGADTSLIRLCAFDILGTYVRTWMEPQQDVNALMDANGEVVISVWDTANVLGDSGPTLR